MNVIPFRETRVVPFPSSQRPLADRQTDRRRYRRESDRTFIGWMTVMFLMVYAIGYWMGILSR